MGWKNAQARRTDATGRHGGGQSSPQEQRPTYRDRGRSQPPDRQGRSGGRRRRDPRSGGFDDLRLRGFGRCGRCRGQGARLSQLARPDEGRSRGHVREERQDGHPAPQPRPALYHAGLRATHTAWAQPAAGAQCRPSDDQSGDPPARWQRSAGGHHGCDLHQPDRAARSQAQRGARQQPQGLDLYRKAQDARAGGMHLHQRAVRRGGGLAGTRTPHDQGRRDG